MRGVRMVDAGCCAGHECDDCVSCQGGRCCRKDNRDYVLPSLGDWQPVFGQIGLRKTDGVRMECHACGLWFMSVAQHAWRSHDLTTAEYRAVFGLTRVHALAGEQTVERFRAHGRATSMEFPAFLANRGNIRQVDLRTPEQRLADSQKKSPEEMLRLRGLGRKYGGKGGLRSSDHMAQMRASRTEAGNRRLADAKRKFWAEVHAGVRPMPDCRPRAVRAQS